jgi:hypothetical protein
VASGKVLNQVTTGQWLVLDLLSVDETLGWVYFTAVGREAGLDPYYVQLYRVKLDGTGLTRLSPENDDHQISTSPSGKYFLDVHSTRDAAPVSVVRSPDGRVLQSVETADISRLIGTGWKPAIPFRAGRATASRMSMATCTSRPGWIRERSIRWWTTCIPDRRSAR